MKYSLCLLAEIWALTRSSATVSWCAWWAGCRIRAFEWSGPTLCSVTGRPRWKTSRCSTSVCTPAVSDRGTSLCLSINHIKYLGQLLVLFLYYAVCVLCPKWAPWPSASIKVYSIQQSRLHEIVSHYAMRSISSQGYYSSLKLNLMY